MPLKSRVCSSQCSLVLHLLFAAALAAGPAFGQLTGIRLTAPVSQSVTCPPGAPGGSGANSVCVNLTHGTSVQFTVNYAGTAPFDPSVSWSFGSGGSNTIGTISSSGLYTAPASIFKQDTIVIQAASTSSPGISATATVFLIPTVGIVVSPNTTSLTDGQSQSFQATVTGTANTAVTFSMPDGTPGTLQTTSLTTAQYTAPVPITSRLTFNVTAKSVADPNQTATSAVTIIPAAQAGVTVNPRAVTIRNGGDTQQFAATVVGLSSSNVTWSISPQVGSILSTGLYIAPANITSNQTVTVTATSSVNSSFTGTATVTLAPPAIQISPSNVTLSTNQTQQFAATVNGAPFNDVTWSLSSAFGTISKTGLYTAPAFAPVKLVIQIIATSNSDPTYFGTTNVTVNQSTAAISPSTVTLTNGGVQLFVFTIDGVADTNPAADVLWTLSSNVGKIAADGTYTAPPAVTTSQSVTLTAIYLLDPTKTAKATINLTTFVDVGHGAPNATIQEMFVTNFYRNGFSNLVSLPPLGDVKKLGATGYVQEFQDANKTSGVKLALVKPNGSTAAPVNGVPTIFQIMGDLYGYYSSVGVTTAGYPTSDTLTCPFFDPNNSCTYGIFDKGVALFVYKVPVFASQTQFTVSGVVYTKWAALGGMSGGPGRPIDAQVAVTSSTKITANEQTFSGGAIYQITSGANNSQVFAVLGSINDQYLTQGGPTGYLGLPTANEIVQTNGDHRQTFEGGALQFTPGQTPVVRLPVGAVTISGAATLKMNAGDTTTVKATPMTAGGAALTDRTVTWSTTNGNVISIAQTSGNGTATLKAVGGGTASVRASADGIVSLPVVITVTSQCCAVGEGAPTTLISQAFQNAITRNHLNILLPAGSSVQRQGHGYVQQLQDATSGSNITYLVTKSDNAANAYVLTGAILTRYQQLGGVTGTLGYPITDATAGGTQTFENTAALSGSPVMLISGAIFTKWSAMGGDSGAAGPPTGAAAAFSTIGANAGSAQAFKNGVIYAATNGPRTGQAYFVSGLILARYNAVGGPSGSFGMAISDEFVSGATHRQNFEGGYIDFNAGDTVAQAHASEQKPAVSAPQSVLAGSRLHLAISGFAAGATIRVSITGQPDFTVTTANGAYAWDVYVPLTAKASTNSIHAADVNSTDTADASYNVLSLANNRATFAKTQGDVQAGMPGALLPLPLQVALRDASGNPVIGAPVVFQSTPGATLVQSSSTTDQNGQAQTSLRLPAAQGLAAVTVDSPGIASAPVTFFVTATASSLASFPKQTQTSTNPLGSGTATIAQKGALLTAVSSILRYYQNRGDLDAPNGLADPPTLNQFLKSFCAPDSGGRQICDGFLTNSDSGEQVVNLWRAGEFVGGNLDVSVERADPDTIRDLVAAGSPVLVTMALTGDNNPVGGHSVVAIGVGDSGQILIQDPSAVLAQTSLDGYTNGFAASGRVWSGQIQGVIRLLPRAPLSTRFLLSAVSQPLSLLQNFTLEARSIAGACGRALDLTDSADVTATLLPPAPRVSRLAACDGSQALYQINVGTTASYKAAVTDLSKGGTSVDLSASAPASYKASRPSQLLTIAPQNLTILDNGGIVNGASLTPGLAPGGLVSIFGSGLSGAGGDTTVTIKGESAQVVSAAPFLVSAVVPSDLAPGTYDLQIQSVFGLVTQSVDILANAPAIFPQNSSTQVGVTNTDGSQNSNLKPAVRGQDVTIYATGLGTVTQQNNSSVVTTPVVAVVAGTELTPSFAGLAPGLTGVYQLTVTIPGSTPPGLDLPLLLRQGGAESNNVTISVQ